MLSKTTFFIGIEGVYLYYFVFYCMLSITNRVDFHLEYSTIYVGNNVVAHSGISKNLLSNHSIQHPTTLVPPNELPQLQPWIVELL
jgi:hypothetical protein